jgi:hypothetical protein
LTTPFLGAPFWSAIFLRTSLGATIFLRRANIPRRGWTMRRYVPASNVSPAAAALLRRRLLFPLRKHIVCVEQNQSANGKERQTHNGHEAFHDSSRIKQS